MQQPPNDQLEPILDVDLCGWLCFKGLQPHHTSFESNRVALWFPSSEVKTAKSEIAGGKAKADIRLWSSLIRQLHADFFSPAAKVALRSRSEDNNFNVQ